jgi:hypothetical protein
LQMWSGMRRLIVDHRDARYLAMDQLRLCKPRDQVYPKMQAAKATPDLRSSNLVYLRRRKCLVS